MPGSVVCNVCGGKDFYNEAGFYFCNECQTQTQELREQVFDQQDNTAFLRITKTTVRHEKTITEVKLTSWEIFNHILYGLVEELNTLGANKDFKEVCYHLWTLYLTKLEIMSMVPDGLPKMSACFRPRDAEIIFNRSFRRKRKKTMSATASVISQSSGTSNELDIKMIRKERTKQRRKLVRAEYDEYSNTKSSDTSMHNQTLSSLGSDDESASSGSQITFTKSARRELLKIMSSEHLNRHINDKENKMTCHKFSQKLFRQSYKDANVLTRNKLYSVIYIALRLTQDSFQLNDIIRFCREGHLSYLDYKHFFPDMISEDSKNENVYMTGLQTLLCSETTRKQAWDIYQFLGLKKGDISPDLVDLCRRYCTELNLPDEIFNISANFIRSTNPKFQTNQKTKLFPNHEGRAMAFIMFALKVLFGLDGATEYEFSKFAKLLNKKQTSQKMFVFDEWFNYIQYRKLVLKNTHFPTKFLFEPSSHGAVDMYLKFIRQKKILCDLDEAATLPMKIAKKYLRELEIFEEDANGSCVEFKPSATPFRSYIDLIKSEQSTVNDVPINLDILEDRSKDTVSFIVHHLQHLKTLKSTKCKIKHSGKNTKHVFHKIRRNNWEIYDVYRRRWHEKFHKDKMEILHFDHLLDKILHKQKEKKRKAVVSERLNKSEPIIKYVDQKQITLKSKLGRNSKGRFCKKDSAENVGVENFKSKHSNWFVSSWIENPLLTQHKYNPSLTYQVVQDVERKLNRSENDVEHLAASSSSKSGKMKYPVHYCPWLEYWVNVQDFSSRPTAAEWNEFHGSLPANFRWLLAECAAIIEQKPVELFLEFVNVELYMCYVHVDNAPVLNKYCDNYKTITKLIQKVKSNW